MRKQLTGFVPHHSPLATQVFTWTHRQLKWRHFNSGARYFGLVITDLTYCKASSQLNIQCQEFWRSCLAYVSIVGVGKKSAVTHSSYARVFSMGCSGPCLACTHHQYEKRHQIWAFFPVQWTYVHSNTHCTQAEHAPITLEQMKWRGESPFTMPLCTFPRWTWDQLLGDLLPDMLTQNTCIQQAHVSMFPAPYSRAWILKATSGGEDITIT